MADDLDATVRQAEATICNLFAQVNLNPEEKEFVNSAGRQLAASALDLFSEVPVEKREKMRGIAIALAIAIAAGNANAWELGVDAYSGGKEGRGAGSCGVGP